MAELQDDLFAGAGFRHNIPVRPEEPEPEEIEPPVELLSEEVEEQEVEEDPTQSTLFELEQFDWWREHWVGMPEFIQEDLTPWKSITVHFESRAHMKSFAALVDQTITDKTRSLWYPEAEIGRMVDKRFIHRSNI